MTPVRLWQHVIGRVVRECLRSLDIDQEGEIAAVDREPAKKITALPGITMDRRNPSPFQCFTCWQHTENAHNFRFHLKLRNYSPDIQYVVLSS